MSSDDHRLVGCGSATHPADAGDSYVSLPSSSGTVRVSLAEWTELAAVAAPDVVFMLSDEIASVSSGGSSRTRKSIDRSNQWQQQQLADLRSRPSLRSAAVFAAVQGGNSLDNRARACASVSAMKADGVVIGGLNTGEERHERCSIVKCTVAALPPHLPRMLSCVGGPEDMLDAGAVSIPNFATPNPFQKFHTCVLHRSLSRHRPHGLQLQQHAGRGGACRRVPCRLAAAAARHPRHEMR